MLSTGLNPKDVQERRLEIFGKPIEWLPIERRVNGGSTPGSHCDICPLGVGETCTLACNTERAKIDAEYPGVKVT
jgi:hypothetical protein